MPTDMGYLGWKRRRGSSLGNNCSSTYSFNFLTYLGKPRDGLCRYGVDRVYEEGYKTLMGLLTRRCKCGHAHECALLDAKANGKRRWDKDYKVREAVVMAERAIELKAAQKSDGKHGCPKHHVEPKPDVCPYCRIILDITEKNGRRR